jgi:hypothetical protein
MSGRRCAVSSALILMLLQGCAAEPAPAGDTVAPVLVDPAYAPTATGEQGWGYVQVAQADLDGDGQDERVVLRAQAERVRGRLAWDDGQPWQVYVEETDGVRTDVYARRLQLGTLTLRLSRGEAEQPSRLVLLEHLPDSLSIYEVAYRGPGRLQVSERFARTLDPRGDLASPDFP